jgi:hypothetical protein
MSNPVSDTCGCSSRCEIVTLNITNTRKTQRRRKNSPQPSTRRGLYDVSMCYMAQRQAAPAHPADTCSPLGMSKTIPHQIS